METGIRIRGTFYPFNGKLKTLDAPLIRHVTGLTWHEFIELVGSDDQENEADQLYDPTVIAGLAAVAVSRANPDWSRDKVRRFMQDIDLEQIEDATPSEDVEEDADPPAVGVTGPAKSASSAAPSKSGSDSRSTSSNRTNSGLPESVTGSPV